MRLQINELQKGVRHRERTWESAGKRAESFQPRELLEHTRLCSAITYAFVQRLTLRGWFCSEAWTLPISPRSSSELLSVFVTCFEVAVDSRSNKQSRL